MKHLTLLFFLFSFANVIAQHNKSTGFTENKGQIIDQNYRPNNSVRYLLNTDGLNVQLRKNGFSYDIYEVKTSPVLKTTVNDNVENFVTPVHKKNAPIPKTIYQYHRIDIEFVGSNKNVSLIPEEKLQSHSSYYNVPGNRQGVENVHSYKKVTYKNIYTNIDVVFTIPKDSSKPAEYNFIVHPGGKVSDIQMKFNGAPTKLADNKIKIDVRFGEMHEVLPASWIEDRNTKKDITVAYKKIKKNVYGFDLDNSGISDKTIVIDPVPIRIWGTYFGDVGYDNANDIVIDGNNDLVLSGGTTSSNNIATAGSYQPVIQGSGNGFFSKFNTDGVLLWSTYFPVSGGIATDHNLNIYIYGSTLTNLTLATPGAFQTTKNNYNDTYLIKLDSSGFRQWATYYGGNENEEIYSLAFDTANNIYVVGGTNSTDVFSTPGAYQENNQSTGSYSDGFIAKFSPTGNRIWGTFYGGDNADSFFSGAISDDGFIYVIGSTNSQNNISTPGSYMPGYNGQGNGMMIKFDLNGQRIWGTYMGTNQSPFNLILRNNNAFMQGRTNAQSGVATPGTFHENYITTGTLDPSYFIIKFDLQNQQKVWGTYFFEQITGMAVNQNQEVYFSGETGENSGVTTPDAYMPTKTNYHKAFLIKLTHTGQRQWGTYYGGNFAEQMPWIAIDNQNYIYMWGNTNGSTTGIATPGAHDTTLGSNPDAFLAKFKDCYSATTASSNSPICSGSDLHLSASGGTGYLWSGPNGFSSTQQNPVILSANASQSGQYSCIITGTGGCDNTSVATVVIGDAVLPVPDLAALPQINGTCSATITTIPTATDNCTGTINGTTINPLSYSLPGTYSITWKYDDGNGNIASQNQTVVIAPNPDPITPQINYPKCDGNGDGKENFNLTSQQASIINSPDYSFSFFRNLADAQTQNNPITNTSDYESLSPLQSIFVRVLNVLNGCSSLSEIILTINQKPIVSNTVLTKCDIALNGFQKFDLRDAIPNINNAAGLQFDFYNSVQDLNDGIVIANFQSFENTANNQIVYAKITNSSGCFSIAEIKLTINPIIQKTISDFLECDDDYDGKTNFDLTIKHAEILLSLPTGNYTFTNYLNLSDSALGTNNIPNQFINSVPATEIFIQALPTNGCPVIFKTTLYVMAKPVLNFDDQFPICGGKNIVLTAPDGFDRYEWSTGLVSKNILLSSPGNYSLTVSKNYGAISCSVTENFTLVESNVAKITDIQTSDWTNDSNTINIVATGSGKYEYSIDGINYQSDSQFTDLANGLYTVYVKDKNECGIAKKDIYLLMYPNYFTPNGDGYNDTWKIQFSNLEPGLEVIIFDRHGTIIQSLYSNGPGWDGKVNGKELPSSDYWFVVTRADGNQYRGHFSLKR